jgi:hypothetical protein
MYWTCEIILGLSLGFEFIPRSEDFGNIAILDLLIVRFTLEWV